MAARDRPATGPRNRNSHPSDPARKSPQGNHGQGKTERNTILKKHTQESTGS
ncbi:hypothetical protein [Azospirillum endophyticum]